MQPTAPLTPRLAEAFALALQLHDGQSRKSTGVPFISHLMVVAALVLEGGGDEDTAIAALLHDAVEDAGGASTLALIQARFGERVANIVEECTETDLDPKPPWRGRKEYYLDHLLSACPEALLLALCDKVANSRNLLDILMTDGVRTWDAFSAGPDEQIWWHQELLRIFTQRLADMPNTELAAPLRAELERLVAGVCEYASCHVAGDEHPNVISIA